MEVLVVDDMESMRNLYEEIIGRHFPGVKVVFAKNGEEGWQKFYLRFPDNQSQDVVIDVVITDLEMETEQAGLLLSQRIKAVSPATPVIMVSGTMMVEKPASCDFFLLKPVNLGVLVETIRKALELTELTRKTRKERKCFGSRVV